MTEPASLPADGSLKVLWVPAIADPAAPTVAELTATGAVDLSCYLTGDGYTPGTDEAVINDDRQCSRQSLEKPGRVTDTLGLRYVYRPQAVAAADNKAYTTLKHLTSGFVVSRWGQDYEEAVASGDIVDVVPSQCGVQGKQAPEANSVLKIAQKMFITGAVQRDVAVV